MTSDVGIFWDFENCRPPKNSSGYEIVNSIRDIAHEYGSVKLLKAYVEPDPLSRAHLRSELQLSGVSLTDCPHNGHKEVADKMIIVDAMLWALENSPSATVILITGDRDFGYAVSMLRLRRYQVVVISQTQLHSPPHLCLTQQASHFYSWEEHVLKIDKPAHPTHSRTNSAPANVPTTRSDTTPPKPRARSASVAVTSSICKATTSKSSAGAASSVVAPTAPPRPSLPTTPPPSQGSVPPCEQTAPSSISAGTEPPVTQPPQPSQPPCLAPVSQGGSSNPPAMPASPPRKPLPPVRVEQLNAGRGLRSLSLLSPSPMTIRSNVSVVHANGEFCGKSILSTTVTTTASPTEVEPPVAIEESASAPEPIDVANSESTIGNSLPVVDISLHPISEADATTPSTPNSSIASAITQVEIDEPETITRVDGSPSSYTSSLTLGDGPLDDHPQAVEAAQLEESCSIFGKILPEAAPTRLEEIPAPIALDDPENGPKLVEASVLHPSLLVEEAMRPAAAPGSEGTPVYFHNLIKLLQGYRTIDLFEPLMSKVAAELPDRVKDEHAAGVARFGQFCVLAQEYGIIDVGNPGPGREWIRLCPSFYRFSLVLEETKRKHSVFAVLVEVLLELQSQGKTKPSRSEVALRIVRRCPHVYKDAGVNKFAQYATKATNAKVVILGFPSAGTSGDAWISLNPEYVG